MEFVAVSLPHQEPFDGAGLLEFLARRAVKGVEEVAGDTYRRSLRLPGGAATVELRPAAGRIEARFGLSDPSDLDEAIARVRGLFDLDADPAPILATLGDDPLLATLVRTNPGRRVPGSVDGYELAVRAVLGQQVSVAGAATLAGRLVARHGDPVEPALGTVTHLFPSSAALAEIDPESMAMPRARGRALRALSAAIASRELTLDGAVDPVETRHALLALPGIGPWTADYLAMRVLHDADAFLPSDLGVRRALERLGQDGRPRAAAALAERWRPYRAYALMHLWSSLSAGDRTRRIAAPLRP